MLERRVAARIATKLPVGCRIPASPVWGTILDLSRSGCRMKFANRSVPPGSTVYFEVPGGPQVAGEVVWSEGSNSGIRFSRALSQKAAVELGLEAPDETTTQEVPTVVEPPQVVGLLRHWFRRLRGLTS